MKRCFGLVCSILVVLVAVLAVVRASRAHTVDQLQSFYVVREYFSDLIDASHEEVLEVTPQGKDVRVCVIRISVASFTCGGSVVRAAERIFPNTTVRKLTGRIDPCSYTEAEVDNAIKAAATVGDYSDSAAVTMVAKCGQSERAFNFPYPAQIKIKELHRHSRRVDRLWDLAYMVRTTYFGDKFSFDEVSPQQDKEFQDLGTKLVPELVSGKFDGAFDENACDGHKCPTGYFAWRLKGYTGIPVPPDPSTVQLTDAASFHLLKYVAPIYPTIDKISHVEGEVHLKIIVDPTTGVVTGATFVSGQEPLSHSAIDAAKQWQFVPGMQSGAPAEVILKYTLCPVQ